MDTTGGSSLCGSHIAGLGGGGEEIGGGTRGRRHVCDMFAFCVRKEKWQKRT